MWRAVVIREYTWFLGHVFNGAVGLSGAFNSVVDLL